MIRAIVNNQRTYQKRIEHMLYLIDTPSLAVPVVMRNASLAIVKSACGDSRLGVVRFILSKFFREWMQEKRARLHRIIDRILGRDPLAELEREVSRL